MRRSVKFAIAAGKKWSGQKTREWSADAGKFGHKLKAGFPSLARGMNAEDGTAAGGPADMAYSIDDSFRAGGKATVWFDPFHHSDELVDPCFRHKPEDGTPACPPPHIVVP